MDIDDNRYFRKKKAKQCSQKTFPLDGGYVWPTGDDPKDLSYIASKTRPATPATTPPPVESVAAQKFHEIIIPSDAITAIDVQNSLRSALNIYFPPETTCFRQHTFAIDNDRLWKPVFHNNENPGHDGATVDQIIAIGCEDSVAKEFFHSISAQVENLGYKKRNPSRTSKLDIRYASLVNSG
jgi:hypothetical protein